MKYILCLMAVLCHQWLFAQVGKPLTVGDHMPDRILRPILNSPYTTYHLTAETGKLFILDFFDTRCGSCIAALPMLDSLQNHFKDSVSILVVSTEPATAISNFLKTNPKVKNVRLPFLTGDSILNQIFPHYLIPHEVWIRKGKVLAITEAYAITRANLLAALSPKGIQLPLKNDLLEFNPEQPLRSQIAAIDSTLFLRQNLLTHQVTGLGTRRGTQVLEGTKRIYFINWGLLSLFQHAWKFQANRVILDISEPARYLDRTSNPDEWKKNNLYCYEGIFPENCPDSLVLEDLKISLQSASPLQGSWQKREMPCYVLHVVDNGPKRSGYPKQTYRKDKITDSLFLLGHSLAAITAICNSSALSSPGKPIILDETGINYPIDLVLPDKALPDPLLLAQALKPYHILLTPAKRVVSVFVLTENPHYQTTTKKQ